MVEYDDVADLVLRARRGEMTAQEALVRRFLRPAYSVALGVMRHPADAQDVAQESLMVALERLDQCREPSRFAAWLLKSVRHRALNHLTKRLNRSVLLDQMVKTDVTEVNPRGDVLLRQRLIDALEVLNAVQREVVLLHDLQDWKHAEIANVLKISETMSRQHLFVARRALRQKLGEDFGNEVLHG
ncbi:MAG: sigma-70 family RNA polymerase sigma factor [Candidatus Alcyoniella australis]|nr:sigma-70 family RNA polymerase sigma factor [Candidatus Alcyoniella australis]